MYALAPRGRALVRRWLAEPVTVAEAGRDNGALELKLAYMSSFLPQRLSSFLDEWIEATSALTLDAARNIEEWRGQLPLSGELALVLGYETLKSRSAALARARARFR